jgi:iron complex transport system ATP-binding protein
MIARALAQKTDFILLDEPTSFLDFPSKVELMSLLKDIAEREQIGILFSSPSRTWRRGIRRTWTPAP